MKTWQELMEWMEYVHKAIDVLKYPSMNRLVTQYRQRFKDFPSMQKSTNVDVLASQIMNANLATKESIMTHVISLGSTHVTLNKVTRMKRIAPPDPYKLNNRNIYIPYNVLNEENSLWTVPSNGTDDTVVYTIRALDDYVVSVNYISSPPSRIMYYNASDAKDDLLHKFRVQKPHFIQIETIVPFGQGAKARNEIISKLPGPTLSTIHQRQYTNNDREQLFLSLTI